MMLSWVRLGPGLKLPRSGDVALSLAFISHSINIRELLKQGLVHAANICFASAVCALMCVCVCV